MLPDSPSDRPVIQPILTFLKLDRNAVTYSAQNALKTISLPNQKAPDPLPRVLLELLFHGKNQECRRADIFGASEFGTPSCIAAVSSLCSGRLLGRAHFSTSQPHKLILGNTLLANSFIRKDLHYIVAPFTPALSATQS
jgi:hypothetical protein